MAAMPPGPPDLGQIGTLYERFGLRVVGPPPNAGLTTTDPNAVARAAEYAGSLDAIGEDIVLTWSMLGSRGLVQYEPVAIGFTVVPERLDRLLSQRSRWARGMLEGLRTHPPPKQPRVLARLVAGIDYLVPFLDIGVIFFWVPGVILFLFGYPLIFGWWSMLLLPITLAVFGFLQRWQARHVFFARSISTRSPISAASSATFSPTRC